MYWGGASYNVSPLCTSQGNVQRVCLSFPEDVQKEEKFPVQFSDMARLKPYKSTLIRAKVDQQPGSNLLVYPQHRYSVQTSPLLVEVDVNRTIPVPVDNQSKVHKSLKVRFTCGSVR